MPLSLLSLSITISFLSHFHFLLDYFFFIILTSRCYYFTFIFIIADVSFTFIYYYLFFAIFHFDITRCARLFLLLRAAIDYFIIFISMPLFIIYNALLFSRQMMPRRLSLSYERCVRVLCGCHTVKRARDASALPRC